jgi:hypothetical protein
MMCLYADEETKKYSIQNLDVQHTFCERYHDAHTHQHTHTSLIILQRKEEEKNIIIVNSSKVGQSKIKMINNLCATTNKNLGFERLARAR